MRVNTERTWVLADSVAKHALIRIARQIPYTGAIALVSGLALFASTGCGVAQSAPPHTPASAPVEVPRLVVTPDEVTDIPTLYARASELAKNGKHLGEIRRALGRERV